MSRNKLAGTTKGTSRSAKHYHDNPESRAKKLAYDTKFHSTKARRKYRSELGKANRENPNSVVNDGLDVAHKGTKIGGLKSQSANRGSNSDSAGDRRARGKRR